MDSELNDVTLISVEALKSSNLVENVSVGVKKFPFRVALADLTHDQVLHHQ